ncbi:hypothetical protein QFW77_01785 [Luteimonas sp. RD2P54]|uniref:Uncharacterized protein n=1 Tax=Luteimonas endophytica TaxID=3042023 RepID=A0ABT6J4H7_9GAMM|nr:hypothetical protein [Luteimonas endophytica]MDH5821726.1 hypothetical protein [Luteimonas endophytica]
MSNQEPNVPGLRAGGGLELLAEQTRPRIEPTREAGRLVDGYAPIWSKSGL